MVYADLPRNGFGELFRTVDEFTAPFADPEGPVRRAGLVLEHVETRVVRCPSAVACGEHGDPARFAHESILTLRSWSEAIFASGMATSRPGVERQAILGRFLRFARVTGADFARWSTFSAAWGPQTRNFR